MREWQAYKTPCYEIDMVKFRENCLAIMEPFGKRWSGRVEFGYSVKTNHEAALMRYAAEQLGWYIETVSPDEYAYALAVTGPGRVIFNGPCKGDTLFTAYENGSLINLDHLAEVEALCSYVREQQGNAKKGTPEVGLRLNFALEALCPGETTAGEEVSRFGICYENGDFKRAVEMLREAGIPVAGIHLHTSTKSRSARVFTMLARKAAELVEEYGLTLSYVDMGGGFFGGQKVPGKPDMEEYAECICAELEKSINPEQTRLLLEPGASVLATCVSYLTRVINVREVGDTKVVTLDGTLLHINPFLSHREPPYKWYPVENSGYGEHQDAGADSLGKTKDGVRKAVGKQIVCGSTCMENDRFLSFTEGQQCTVGDLFVFGAAGAYTMAFNSDFILHPPKVYIAHAKEDK